MEDIQFCPHFRFGEKFNTENPLNLTNKHFYDGSGLKKRNDFSNNLVYTYQNNQESTARTFEFTPELKEAFDYFTKEYPKTKKIKEYKDLKILEYPQSIETIENFKKLNSKELSNGIKKKEFIAKRIFEIGFSKFGYVKIHYAVVKKIVENVPEWKNLHKNPDYYNAMKISKYFVGRKGYFELKK
jgi:hypothetical protein